MSIQLRDFIKEVVKQLSLQYGRKKTRQMRSSTNLYLCALGCSDSAVICTAIFLFCVDSIRRYSLHLSVLFGALSPLVYPAGMTAQMCSVYFTVVAGADCFVQKFGSSISRSCRQFGGAPNQSEDYRPFTLIIESGNVAVAQVACSCKLVTVILATVQTLISNITNESIDLLAGTMPINLLAAVVLECWHATFKSRSLEVCPDPFRFLPTWIGLYETSDWNYLQVTNSLKNNIGWWNRRDNKSAQAGRLRAFRWDFNTFLEKSYMLIYYKYMYSLFLAIGPLVVLVVLNLCIIGASVFSNTESESSSGDTAALVNYIRKAKYFHYEKQGGECKQTSMLLADRKPQTLITKKLINERLLISTQPEMIARFVETPTYLS
uniref:Anoctamin n=1 Tax=Parascaris equorum TaxID=6256 RepID=A0A914RMD0_PAREQ